MDYAPCVVENEEAWKMTSHRVSTHPSAPRDMPAERGRTGPPGAAGPGREVRL